MKNFIKRFWSGLLTTVVMVAIATVVWALYTVAVLAVMIFSPVILILSVHGSYKISTFGNATKEFLNGFERIIENAEEKLS